MDSTQVEVKALLDRWSEACRAKDIERLMAPTITFFDVVPRFVTPETMPSGAIPCAGLRAGKATAASKSVT